MISNINPKDHQNYHSCIQLILDNVLRLLDDDENANGTLVCLTLSKMIVRAYIDKTTCIHEHMSIIQN